MLFRYGVVVLMGLSSVEEMSLLSELEPLVIEPFSRAAGESVTLVLSDTDKEGIQGF